MVFIIMKKRNYAEIIWLEAHLPVTHKIFTIERHEPSFTSQKSYGEYIIELMMWGAGSNTVQTAKYVNKDLSKSLLFVSPQKVQ